MDDLDRLFRDAERVKPSAGLWRSIAAASPLSGKAEERSLRESQWMRMAAGLALAATVAGLIALGAKRGGNAEGAAPVITASAAAESTAPAAVTEEEFVDPELLGWQADLGEVELEAEEAGEVL